jgi:hypothetical protein
MDSRSNLQKINKKRGEMRREGGGVYPSSPNSTQCDQKEGLSLGMKKLSHKERDLLSLKVRGRSKKKKTSKQPTYFALLHTKVNTLYFVLKGFYRNT